MTEIPIMVTTYTAQCCGTCKHNRQKYEECEVDCELGGDPTNKYSICANMYVRQE